MRSYASFAPTFWTKGSGKRLRGNRDAQLVGAYLITCPSSTMVGIYYLPLTIICHELDMTLAEAREALRVCAEQGFAFYDEASEVAWVPNLARIDIGDQMKAGDKRRSKILAELEPFTDHPFYERFLEVYGDAYMLTPPPSTPKGHAATPDAPSKGHARSPATPGAGRNGMGSDQGELERGPTAERDEAPRPKPERVRPGVMGFGAEAFRLGVERGVREASGNPRAVVAPFDRFAERDVMRLLEAHAPPGLDGEAASSWLTQTGHEYVLATFAGARYERGFHPSKCIDWFNAGKPVARPPKPTRIVQTEPEGGSIWKVGTDE